MCVSACVCNKRQLLCVFSFVSRFEPDVKLKKKKHKEKIEICNQKQTRSNRQKGKEVSKATLYRAYNHTDNKEKTNSSKK